MKNSKWITSAAVVALSATMAFAAPGNGQEGKRGHGRGGHGEAFGAGVAQKLNLTDAQKQQIRQLSQGFRASNKVFFDTHRQTMKDFRAAKQANDTARVESLKATLDAQRVQVRELRSQLKQQLLTVLTPEQRAQYDALKAERKAHGGKRGKRQ